MDPIEQDLHKSLEVEQAQDVVNPIILVGGELTVGSVVDGRYRVEEVIGRGGFGVVYRVKSTLSKKDLALKTLNSIGATDMFRLRLRKEAEASSRLVHPNLVHSLDFGFIQDQLPYLIMDFIVGETLDELLQRRGSLPVTEALNLFIPLAEGLAYAHQNGVVHRDIKPSNVILEHSDQSQQPIPKIVDFGIAKIRFPDDNEAQVLTQTGDVFGTPMYMSPEQCAGTRVDQRSDIYALGCVLFEALTGTPPFQGRSALETIVAHAHEAPPTLKQASLGKDFSDTIELIVGKMLAKDPEKRYQDCESLVRDLQAASQGKTLARSLFDTADVHGSRAGGMSKALSQISRRQIALGAGAVALTAAFCVGLANTLGGPKALAPLPRNTFESQTIRSYVPHVDTTSGYFSTVNGNKRTFKFPDQTLGFLQWYGCEKPIQMRGEVTVPADVALVIKGEMDLLEQNLLLAKFRPTEIYGVIIDEHIQTDSDVADQFISALHHQKNLRMLRLTNVGLSQEGIKDIGKLEGLRWVDLHKINYEKPKIMQGDRLAQLQNISKLRVLYLANADHLLPILQKLKAGNAIERLGLASCRDFNAPEQELITSLATLKTLQITTGGSPFAKSFINRLAQLPNLTRLGIEYPGDKTDFLERYSGLKKLTHLKQIHFILGATSEVTKEMIAKVLPPQLDQERDVQLIDNRAQNNVVNIRSVNDQGWFDVKYEDLRTLKP